MFEKIFLGYSLFVDGVLAIKLEFRITNVKFDGFSVFKVNRLSIPIVWV